MRKFLREQFLENFNPTWAGLFRKSQSWGVGPRVISSE